MQKDNSKKQIQKPPDEPLASLLSKTLHHPELPAPLYDAIIDALLELSSYPEYDTEEMIEFALKSFERREQRRKGGAR